MKQKMNKSEGDIMAEVIELNNHRLLNGDATNQDDVKQLIGNTKVNLLLTDPPYGINIVNIEREHWSNWWSKTTNLQRSEQSEHQQDQDSRERERANDKNRKGGYPWRCTTKTLQTSNGR